MSSVYLPVEMQDAILYWIISPNNAVNCMLVCKLWHAIIRRYSATFGSRVTQIDYHRLFPLYSAAYNHENRDSLDIKDFNKLPGYEYALRLLFNHSIKEIYNICKVTTETKCSALLSEALGLSVRILGYQSNEGFSIVLVLNNMNIMYVQRTKIVWAIYGMRMDTDRDTVFKKTNENAENALFASYLKKNNVKLPPEEALEAIYSILDDILSNVTYKGPQIYTRLI